MKLIFCASYLIQDDEQLLSIKLFPDLSIKGINQGRIRGEGGPPPKIGQNMIFFA
jgi:hypothetical protein